MSEYELFSGKILEDGSLSTAHLLSSEVPFRFLDGADPWVAFAKKFMRESVSERGWKWESEDDDERSKQRECVTAALATQYLSEVKRRGMVALMLYNMLQELPEDA